MRSLGDGSESLYGNTCVVYRISNGEETAENRGEICYIQGDIDVYKRQPNKKTK